jgi:23S rRNA (uracil1939-C5)-methyltransferase
MSPGELRAGAPPLEEAGSRPRIGQRLRLQVSAMALDGDAIARFENYVLFLAGTMPGEEVEAEVVSTGRKHGRARLLSVLKPSPHRVAAPCPYFGPCGGCGWQHIAYPEQLKLKEKLLSSVLELALGAAVPVGPAVGLDSPWGFRNKVHFVVGRDKAGQTVLGHYGAHSRDLVAVEECRVHSPTGNRVAFRLRDLLRQERVAGLEGDRPSSGVARHVIARSSERSGEVQAVLVATRRKFPGLAEIARQITSGPDSASGFHLNTNRREGNLVLGSFTRKLAGRERLLEEVAGVKFLISPVSFFQTSARAAEKLVNLVVGSIPADRRESVLDLYAGVGLFALPLARRGHRVLAVEENPHAIADGVETARRNDIHGCHFLRARVEGALRSIARRGTFNTVILDPPREGCSDRVLWGVSTTLRPSRIIYVSCDPRALARDLGRLRQAGYIIEEVRPVDMFPHTAHIEAVARLRLGRGDAAPRRPGRPPETGRFPPAGRGRREGRGPGGREPLQRGPRRGRRRREDGRRS